MLPNPFHLPQGGHYVAYVRCGDGHWYLCDDAWVVAGEQWTDKKSGGFVSVAAANCVSASTSLRQGHMLTEHCFGHPPSTVDEDHVRNCQAYMLFYAQKGLLAAAPMAS